jgi:hypothetical protein
MINGPLKMPIHRLQWVLYPFGGALILRVSLNGEPLPDSMEGFSFFHFNSRINLAKRRRKSWESICYFGK